MAQRFHKHLHAGRVSMKYSRRSKRGGRRIQEIKCSDTSMVKSKEDFMKILGLQMKKPEKENDTEEADVMVKKKNDSSTAAKRIRDCSVVIIGENCKICGLLLKCSSDVAFHTEMRHGNGFIVFSNYIEANVFKSAENSNVDIQRRKRRNSNNNNDNKLLLTLKIGDEVISEISIDRKHLKTYDDVVKTEPSRHRENSEESITLKNDYKSSVFGIDSFVSSKNYCDDYVISVQPFNRTHQRASRDTLFFEGSQHNSNSNYVKATIDMEKMNSRNIDSLQERLPRLSLQGNDVMCNNNTSHNNNNNTIHNNNNKSTHTRDSFISECNMSDKENESMKTLPVKKILNVNALVQGVITNLSPYQMDSDNEEIQEILHTVERKRIKNLTNVKRKFEYHGDSMLLHSEEEIVKSPKKICYHNVIKV